MPTKLSTTVGKIEILSNKKNSHVILEFHEFMKENGASVLTDTAYQPNPIEIEVGQKVRWTNDDSAFHTVTSSRLGSADSGREFDSGLAGPSALTSPGRTFEHTLDTTGEFDYYCVLHPAMVGKVIVTNHILSNVSTTSNTMPDFSMVESQSDFNFTIPEIPGLNMSNLANSNTSDFADIIFSQIPESMLPELPKFKIPEFPGLNMSNLANSNTH